MQDRPELRNQVRTPERETSRAKLSGKPASTPGNSLTPLFPAPVHSQNIQNITTTITIDVPASLWPGETLDAGQHPQCVKKSDD